MRGLIVVLILLSSCFTFSQSNYCTQELYPFRGGNKMMGYVNVQKEWVIQPFFDKAFSFTGNMALVERKGKIGAVNCDGDLIIRCEYDEITPFLGGRAWYRQGHKWGLIKDDGAVLLLPLYDTIREIAKYTDQTWVKTNNKWGVYNKFDEKMIWEPQFDTYNQTIDAKYSFVISSTFTGLIRTDTTLRITENGVSVLDAYIKRKYIINSSGKQGVISYKGDVIIPLKYDKVSFSKGRYIVSKGKKFDLFFTNGLKVNKVSYDFVSLFNDQFIAAVTKDNKVNFITRSGKVIFKKSYLSLEYVPSNNNFIAQNNDGYFLLNTLEKKLTPYFTRIVLAKRYYVGEEFNGNKKLISALGFVSEEVFSAVEVSDTIHQIRVKDIASGKYAFYDLTTLEFKTKYVYDELGSMSLGFSVFSLDGKKGVLNNKYAIFIKDQDEVEVVRSLRAIYYLITTQDGLKGALSSSLKVILPQEFSEIVLEDDNFMLTNPKGKFGVYSIKGKEIIPIENTKIISLSSSKVAVSKKGKTYIIYNAKGQALFNSEEFTDVKRVGYNSIPVKKDGLWGYINKKNGKVAVGYKYLDAEPYAEVNGVLKAKVVKQTKEVVYLTARGREER